MTTPSFARRHLRRPAWRRPRWLPAAAIAQAARQPVYVGARACAQCHEGHAAGNQYSKWLLSAHAKAWATLATPEAKVMARLSGLPDDPEKAPLCLGCHATAAETEAWERDPTFRLEDGVQCEKCHGPGSEYMAEDVMRDPEKARRAGLRRFTKRDCEVCHYVKGSHAAVHRRPPLDVDAAWNAARASRHGPHARAARTNTVERGRVLRPVRRRASSSGRAPAGVPPRADDAATSSACGSSAPTRRRTPRSPRLPRTSSRSAWASAEFPSRRRTA